jgi:hypothetical protein
VLFNERHRSELKLKYLRTSRKRGVCIACRPWIPRMCQGYVRAVLTRARVLKQPLAEVLELSRTVLGWQEHAMAIEACGLTKAQLDWTCHPRLGTAE